MIAAFLSIWATFLSQPADPPTVPAQPCQVHVILFVPADVQPPAGYQQRVDEFVGCAEHLFRRGLARWGHRDAVMPFRRAEDGHVEVRLFRGKRPAGDYEPVELRAEVMDALRAEGRINQHRQVWWIMVYAGEPPARFEGFLGGVGEQIGGWAVCNFDTTPGRIDAAAPLGSEFLARLFVKGMLHELGHGFGLPHVGPLDRDRSGNTLMGPTHLNWKRVRGEAEQQVYLCEAEAAMLARHPAFRGVPDDRGKLPPVEVRDLRCAANPRTGVITVAGEVTSTERAIYALIADEAEDRPGEYWTKTYVGDVDPDGRFTVRITETSRAGGTLRIWFVFEDGDHTGDGRGRSRPSGVGVPYAYGEGKWSFDVSAAGPQSPRGGGP